MIMIINVFIDSFHSLIQSENALFTDYEDGKKLLKSLSEACAHLSDYNKRLTAELADRQIVQKKLAEYTAYQKYMLAATEDRLEVRGEVDN